MNAWAWPKSMQTAKRRLQQDTASSTHVIHSKRFMYPLEHQRTMTLTLGTPTKSWKRVCRAASRQSPSKEKRQHPSIISTVSAQERRKALARSPRASISWTVRKYYDKPRSRLPVKNMIQVSQLQSGNAHASPDWTCETWINLSVTCTSFWYFAYA